MTTPAAKTRHVIGCMTGTSLDGLDAALVRITGEGLAMNAEFLGMVSRPLGPLADTLRSFAAGNPHPPLDYLRAARKLGELHAAACTQLVETAASRGATPVDFVVAHGQTIWHAPRDEHGHLSWQLFDPWPLVQKLRTPVCYDLRQADLIAGGEGAPITPLADWVMYRSFANAVVNLGGICNVTVLAPQTDKVRGNDLCPCNLLLDGLCRVYFGEPFDENGEKASRGSVHQAVHALIVEQMMGHSDRSLGRERFSDAWIARVAAEAKSLAEPESVLRSAVHAVAHSIVERVQQELGLLRRSRMVLAGGGARNRALVDAIRQHATAVLSDDLGIPTDAREAMAFAVLGALSQDGVPITLPQVTGSTNPGRAGAWVYP